VPNGSDPADRRPALARLGVAAALAIATFALYARVRGFAFLHFDDNMYVTENPVVRQGLTGSGIGWALTTLHFSNWHPLTWLSHMADVELFGLDAGAHHLVNVALHALNAAILFLVLSRMTGATGRSLLVAALFAAHPLHVESVAWVSERKDVLSTFLGFLALGAYTRYAALAGAAARGRPPLGAYALVAVLFAASLMAKPMWVTLPFLLLLLDVWPLQRLAGSPVERDPLPPPVPRHPAGRLVGEKLPLLALSAASSALTVVAQERGGALRGFDLDLGVRAANAAVAYVRYLGKALWPSSLLPQYAYPAGLPAWQVLGSALLLLAITGLALVRARRAPWLAVGWLWFAGMLVPVIGLVQVGAQSMADRYTYVPLVGLFVAVAWGGAALARSPAVRQGLQAGAVLAVLALAAVAWRQLGHWSDHVSLFRHAVALEPENALAHHILSQGLADRGDLDEALAHADAAVRLDPGLARIHKNRGYVLFRLGRVDESIAALRTAVALQPDYAEAWGNLAVAFAWKGWADEARWARERERELRSRPDGR
jgi:tetratricopeptide (TPR) repeat protein